MYAVVKAGGKQYRVSEGDMLVVNKLEAKEGETITLSEVIALGGEKELALGTKASVSAKVVKQGKDEKVIVFKKKRRHNYRRKIGHRQMITTLEITSINADGKAPANTAAKPAKAEEKKADAKPAAKKETKAAEKPEAKKPAAKKAAAPKKDAKTAEKKPAAKKAAPKSADKPAAKKPAAKKPAAKKDSK